MNDLMKDYYRRKSWWLDDLMSTHENVSGEEFALYVEEVRGKLKDLEKEFIEKRDKEE